MDGRDAWLCPGKTELTDVTNILVSGFQKHIKTCSCQISLDSESCELVTCFLKAQLSEQRLHRTKHLKSELFPAVLAFLCCSCVKALDSLTRRKISQYTQLQAEGPLGYICRVTVALDVGICP